MTNAEVVRAAYDAFNASVEGGDLAEVLPRLFDPDIEWVQAPDAIEAGSRHGHAGVLAAIEAMRESFESARIDIEELVEVGPRVVAVVAFSTRSRLSGLELSVPAGVVWTFRDGRAVRMEAYTDPAQALAAARMDPGES